MTMEDKISMAQNQNFLCLGCGNHKTINQLYVDHNHTTGEVRGLLCGKCNSVLGFAKDSVETLTNLIRYLRNN